MQLKPVRALKHLLAGSGCGYPRMQLKPVRALKQVTGSKTAPDGGDATQAREGIETGWHRLKPVPKLDATQAREGIETTLATLVKPMIGDATQAREGIETTSRHPL